MHFSTIFVHLVELYIENLCIRSPNYTYVNTIFPTQVNIDKAKQLFCFDVFACDLSILT